MLAASPSTSGVPARLFATYGGSTVDVSENGGLDWTRAVAGGGTSDPGFVVDTAGETLWFIAEIVPDEVGALWVSLPASGPLPSTWSVKGFSEWNSNYVRCAAADPFDPHAIYIGGYGRLGYLTTTNGDPTVDTRWSSPQGDPTRPATFVATVWGDPGKAKHVVWGGQQGSGPAQIFESTEGGGQAREIPLEGLPQGSVTSIGYLPAFSKLVFFVRRWSDGTLAAYVIG